MNFIRNNKKIFYIIMQERISQLLKGTQFFDFGEVVFASNHPDYVCLLEVKNTNNELFTVLYDQKHDYLNINKRIDSDTIAEGEEPIIGDTTVELTQTQKNQIIQLLEQSKNNVNE